MDEDELKDWIDKLPLRGLMAFAAELLWRALPLYESDGLAVPAVRQTIEAMERWAVSEAPKTATAIADLQAEAMSANDAAIWACNASVAQAEEAVRLASETAAAQAGYAKADDAEALAVMGYAWAVLCGFWLTEATDEADRPTDRKAVFEYKVVDVADSEADADVGGTFTEYEASDIDDVDRDNVIRLINGADREADVVVAVRDLAGVLASKVRSAPLGPP